MKKLLSLLVITVGVLFIATSCEKSCTCTRWYNGEEKESLTIPLKDEDNNLCKNKNTVVIVNGKKTGLECK